MAQALLNFSGSVWGQFTLKITKVEMVMSADEICKFIHDKILENEHVWSFGGNMDEHKDPMKASLEPLLLHWRETFKTPTLLSITPPNRPMISPKVPRAASPRREGVTQLCCGECTHGPVQYPSATLYCSPLPLFASLPSSHRPYVPSKRVFLFRSFPPSLCESSLVCIRVPIISPIF